MPRDPELSLISKRLSRVGLIARGGFHPEPCDGVPALAGGAPARTLVMVGNAGPAMWRHFSASAYAAQPHDPLNAWTADVLTRIAGELGAEVVFPFSGPPYHPFQRWAMKADEVWPSPIGVLIHPDHGLWHAYRGALLFEAQLALPARRMRPKPCDSCAERPCLSTCPVSAFSAQGYDVARCVAHVRGAAGTDCAEEGCRARRACPVGTRARYAPEQAQFHMRAFERAQR